MHKILPRGFVEPERQVPGSERSDPLVRLVGSTAAVRRIRSLIRCYARSDLPVLILGERGSGKGLVARILHDLRSPSASKFFSLNCSAVPEALAESQLFGHRKGAFTGAQSDRDGLLLAAFRAHGGLLLDDVGEFPAGIQPKLLQAVEERFFYPLGSDRPVSIAIGTRPGLWLYAATQPQALSRLRPDLRDRLSTCVLELPPLRERSPDVLLIADHKLEHLAQQTGCVKSLDPRGRVALLDYDWPGNVRQLCNVLDRAFVLVGEGDVLKPELLAHCIDDERRLERLHGNGSTTNGTPPVDGGAHRFVTLKELEARHIGSALEATGGNVTAAAALLGLKRTTLQSRMRALAGAGLRYPTTQRSRAPAHTDRPGDP